MALFENIFYNILKEDMSSSILNSNTPGTGYGGENHDDHRLPFVYGPKKKTKNTKKKKKKHKIIPFTRFSGSSGMSGPSKRNSVSFG